MNIQRNTLTPESVGLLTRVVASILSGDKHPSWRDELAALGPQQQGNFLRACSAHRIAQIVVSSEYFSEFPEYVRAILAERTKRVSRQVLLLAHRTEDLYSFVSEAGIPCLIYKGIPLALQTTKYLNARGPGDIDILVDPQDVARLHQLLISNGWTSGFGTIPGTGWVWKMYSWLSRELPYSQNETYLDLHWRMSQENGVFPSPRELIQRGEFVTISKTPVLTLSPADALAAACYHFYHDGCQSLRALIDVYRLSQHSPEQTHSAVTSGLEQLVYEVVDFAHTLLGPNRSEHTAITPNRISDLWERNSRVVNIPDERNTVPVNELAAALKLHLGLGNRVSNFFQYLTARVFEFNHLDLTGGISVLAKAFGAEVRFQWNNRVLRKK